MDVIESLQRKGDTTTKDDAASYGYGADKAEEFRGGDLQEEADPEMDAEDNSESDTDADASNCGRTVVGIKDQEGHQLQPQKRKGGVGIIGTDDGPSKRITASADVEQKGNKSHEADGGGC